MEFEFTQEEEALRKEVESWLKQELTSELKTELEGWSHAVVPHGGPSHRLHEFGLKLGAKGWLGMNWPKKYGGQERSLIEQFIVWDEILYQGGVVPNFEALLMMGPTILQYSTEQQKQDYLPGIARGEIEFSLGYTEPQAGSDLASLQMNAVEDGDNYIINGQKVYNTCTHYADYHWLAVKTDLSVPKHRGISVFIVDLKSPGITVRPLWTMGGGRTNEVYYDNVKVPKTNMVGEKNRGWQCITFALDYERLLGFSPAPARKDFEHLVRYVKENERGKKLLASNPLIRYKLAEIGIELSAHKFMHREAIWKVDNGIPLSYETPMHKMLITELNQRLVEIGMEILGPLGLLRKSSRWAVFNGQMEMGYRACVMHTFGGGSSELMRTLIATRGLGLPV